MIVEGTMETIVQDVIYDIDVFTISVPDGPTKLQVTLCWDDYEDQTPRSLPNLENDLDLILIDPLNNPHYPWILNPRSPGQGATTGLNNRDVIEQVRVEVNPPAALPTGVWTIKIKGKKINSTSSFLQRYSLIAQYFPDETANVRFPDKYKLYFKSNEGENVAWFGDNGNLVLKGRLRRFCSNICTSDAQEFVIKNNSGEIVAMLNLQKGDLNIKGDLYEKKDTFQLNDEITDPQRDFFVIKNSLGMRLLFIDNNGDLKLSGGLFEHTLP